MRKTHLIPFLSLAGIGIYSCSDPAPMQTMNGFGGTAPTGTPTGAGATTVPGGGGVSAGGGAAPITQGGATTTAGTGAGVAGAGPAELMQAAACMSLADANAGVSNETAAFSGAAGLYFYGDPATTMCANTVMAGEVCVAGIGADATSEYTNWGAGVGVQMASAGPNDTLGAPFDAATQGIAGFTFNVVGAAVSKAPIRVQVTMIDDPAGVAWTSNGFLNGKDAANDIKADGVVTVMFANLQLPTWSMVDVNGDGTVGAMEYADAVFDPSKIHSIQFQLVTTPNATRPYEVCVNGFQWVDAAGAAIAPTMPATTYDQAGELSMGGAGAGGGSMGGMSMGGGSSAGTGTGGTGVGGAGQAGGGGGAVTFSDVYAILTANCGTADCHGDGAAAGNPPHPEFANSVEATAQGIVDPEIADIITRITSTDLDVNAFGTRRMPPPDMDGLSAEDIATIQAYADSL